MQQLRTCPGIVQPRCHLRANRSLIAIGTITTLAFKRHELWFQWRTISYTQALGNKTLREYLPKIPEACCHQYVQLLLKPLMRATINGNCRTNNVATLSSLRRDIYKRLQLHRIRNSTIRTSFLVLL